MCGIVGYIGTRNGIPLVLEGLKRLEYRGYDSAGVAAIGPNGLQVTKTEGRIARLVTALRESPPAGTVALAHTRWATHGAPTQINAHPHTDCSNTLALVHNGIVENAGPLRTMLTQRGHTFRSQTDTEVVVHLIEEMLKDHDTLEEAVVAALDEVQGTYGLAVISSNHPDTLIAARMGSPILLGIGEGEYFVASDAAALVEHTRSVVYLDDGEVAVLERTGYHVTRRGAEKVDKTVRTIDWDLQAIEKGGFAHFMLKEIMEQPESLRNTLRGRLLEEEGRGRLGGLNMTEDELKGIDRVVLTGCGTSWHAALIGEYMLEELARIPTEVEYASEFRYRNPIVDERTLVVGISQSGETLDTLAAMREARQRGARTLGIVNTVGSTVAREVDGGVYIHAGPEIGVASTKAFTCQVAALALLTLVLGRARSMSVLQGREFVMALKRLPEQVEHVLQQAGDIEDLAREYADSANALYLGRGYNFPVALEGALKLKEISYIHAEGYPAAEMKHGPIALIDENMPVVVVAPSDGVRHKIMANVQEVKARGGRVLAIITEDDHEIAELADHSFAVPATADCLTPILSVLPLQLLAYYIAVQRGCDVDKPRNLAKSVTVE